MTTTTTSYGYVIIVATNGHVWAAKAASIDMETQLVTATNARIIRRWGTDNGLNQLITGPTKETILDAVAPRLDIAWQAILYFVPVSEGNWKKHLK